MIVREYISLADLTTLRVGGSARYVLECQDIHDVQQAVAFVRDRSLPYTLVGQGSNVCASDDPYEGVCIRLHSSKYFFSGETVVADAGVSWDLLVQESVQRGLWGMENLAAIPGTVGASPVQNIGAYGADVSQTIEWVEVFNMRSGECVRLNNAECEFAYRDSIFKRRPEFAIVRVAFRLSHIAQPNIGYKDLQACIEAGESLDTPQQISDAVRRIRSIKFPDLHACGTAGSFFKNPVVSLEKFEELTKSYPNLPTYPDARGVKVSLAWILDKVLYLNGFALGPVHLFERQPLVLVTDAGATSADVDALATEVIVRVYDATNIYIEREVRALNKIKI